MSTTRRCLDFDKQAFATSGARTILRSRIVVTRLNTDELAEIEAAARRTGNAAHRFGRPPFACKHPRWPRPSHSGCRRIVRSSAHPLGAQPATCSPRLGPGSDSVHTPRQRDAPNDTFVASCTVNTLYSYTENRQPMLSYQEISESHDG